MKLVIHCEHNDDEGLINAIRNNIIKEECTIIILEDYYRDIDFYSKNINPEKTVIVDMLEGFGDLYNMHWNTTPSETKRNILKTLVIISSISNIANRTLIDFFISDKICNIQCVYNLKNCTEEENIKESVAKVLDLIKPMLVQWHGEENVSLSHLNYILNNESEIVE